MTRIILAGLACGLMTFAAPVPAATLLPGGVIGLAGTTAAATPALSGTVENDNLIGFTITPYFPGFDVYGAVQNRVTRSDDLGTMIFGPRIRNTTNIATVEFYISSFRLEGFGSFATDVDFRTDGLGDKGPSSVSRSADGDRLTFRYDDPLFVSGLFQIPIREESLFPSILTDAPRYSLTGRMTIFGYDGDDPNTLFQTTITGLAVPAPIPLPASAALLLSAAAGLGMLRRFGKKRGQR